MSMRLPAIILCLLVIASCQSVKTPPQEPKASPSVEEANSATGGVTTTSSPSTTPSEGQKTTKVSKPRIIILDGVSVDTSVFEIEKTWECGEYKYTYPPQLEVGTIRIGSSRSGYILFDGSNEGVYTHYVRQGINSRWDWGDYNDGYAFSFVISPNNIGNYYDFSHVSAGESIKPQQVYYCKQMH